MDVMEVESFYFLLFYVPGNTDDDTIIFNEVNPPIIACTYIPLHPEAWYEHISIGVELYGCPGYILK